jgi:hypothetical protein
MVALSCLDKTEHTHPEKAKNAILLEPPTRPVAGVKNGAYRFFVKFGAPVNKY